MVQVGCASEYGPPSPAPPRRRTPCRAPAGAVRACRSWPPPSWCSAPGARRGGPAGVLAGGTRYPRRLAARAARGGHAARPCSPATASSGSAASECSGTSSTYAGRGAGRPRGLAVRRPGRGEHRHGPRRAAQGRRGRPVPCRRVQRAPTHELDGPPSRPAIAAQRADSLGDHVPLSGGVPGALPVPGRLRVLAAGRRRRTAATGSAGGLGSAWRGSLGRHLDGGGVPHLTTAGPTLVGDRRRAARDRHPRLRAPAARAGGVGRADPAGTPLHWAVLNVSDGPGTRPDPHCLEVAGRLRHAGVRVLGHLALRTATGRGPSGTSSPTPTGTRTGTGWRVTCWTAVPQSGKPCLRVRRLAATLETVLDDADGCHLVLGHGAHPDPATPRSGTSS